jgi:(1->4)-alpha-D-glucan 1-alpha-D-glucosylmutase
MLDGRPAPSPNEEVLIYQSMLGIWPLETAASQDERSQLRERIDKFMQKAAREAKTHSSWVSPNEAHEAAIQNFIAAILDCSVENPFLRDFAEFCERIALPGACNALAQLLLKITSPGVPDFFQGNEIWNFRLTDPDNRHEIDFAKRRELLDGLRAARDSDSPATFAAELIGNWRDGRVKLFLTKEALSFRLANRDLFLKGEYLPLEVEGERRESVCGYARRQGDHWAMTVVPRMVTRLAARGAAFPLGSVAWGSDTALVLPPQAPQNWTNCFSGETLRASGSHKKKRLAIGEIFSQLPFALLAPAQS